MIQTGLYICASIPMLQCPMNIELNTKHDFLPELFTGHSHFPPAQYIDANYGRIALNLWSWLSPLLLISASVDTGRECGDIDRSFN